MPLPYEISTNRPKQIGLVVLQADETIEPDLRRMLPDNVECLVSRVPSGTTLTTDTLRAMETKLTAAASLLPRGARFAAVGYGCTSASAEFGSDRVADLIGAGVQTPHVSDPVVALIAACRKLGVSNIGLVSPYVASVSDKLRAVLLSAGIKVTAFESFEEPIEDRVVRIAPASIQAAATQMGRTDACDAVFLSCTNLRTLDIINDAETQIAKPVLSSNQVLAWHLAQLAGFGDSIKGPGGLLR